MNRRNFFTLLSAMPGLKWLKPKPCKSYFKPYQIKLITEADVASFLATSKAFQELDAQIGKAHLIYEKIEAHANHHEDFSI